MDNFQIETAQNISIQQNVAGIGDRILAFIIDSFLISLFAIFGIIVLAGSGMEDGSLWVIYTIVGLPILLYYLLWEMFWNGRTPGKHTMKLRVVKLDGSNPSFVNYLVRWLLRIIDISISSGGVAVVTILLNGKGQRLGDLAAGTTVISEKKKISFSNTLAVDLPENYIPKYPQVRILKDKDVQEIKNLFIKAKRDGNHQIIIRLANKVAALLNIPMEERPMDFLDRVIKDYNYYTG